MPPVFVFDTDKICIQWWSYTYKIYNSRYVYIFFSSIQILLHACAPAGLYHFFCKQCLGLRIQITWTPDIVTTLIHHKAPMPIWCQPQTFGIRNGGENGENQHCYYSHHSKLTRPFLGERKLLLGMGAPLLKCCLKGKTWDSKKGAAWHEFNRTDYCPQQHRLLSTTCTAMSRPNDNTTSKLARSQPEK